MPQIVSNDDANQIFAQSVCQWEDTLLIVEQPIGGGQVRAIDLFTSKPVLVEQDADKLIAPLDFQLGYYQDGSAAVYLQRAPTRQYRVGWSSRNTHNFPRYERLTTRASSRKALISMVKQEYPTFQRAKEDSVKNEARIAFERQWAIDYALQLHYRGKVVGNFVEGTGVKLSRGFEYLQSQIESLV